MVVLLNVSSEICQLLNHVESSVESTLACMTDTCIRVVCWIPHTEHNVSVSSAQTYLTLRIRTQLVTLVVADLFTELFPFYETRKPIIPIRNNGSLNRILSHANKVPIVTPSFCKSRILQSFLRQVHSLPQNVFSTTWDLVLPLSICSNISFS